MCDIPNKNTLISDMWCSSSARVLTVFSPDKSLIQNPCRSMQFCRLETRRFKVENTFSSSMGGSTRTWTFGRKSSAATACCPLCGSNSHMTSTQQGILSAWLHVHTFVHGLLLMENDSSFLRYQPWILGDSLKRSMSHATNRDPGLDGTRPGSMPFQPRARTGPYPFIGPIRPVRFIEEKKWPPREMFVGAQEGAGGPWNCPPRRSHAANELRPASRTATTNGGSYEFEVLFPPFSSLWTYLISCFLVHLESTKFVLALTELVLCFFNISAPVFQSISCISFS